MSLYKKLSKFVDRYTPARGPSTVFFNFNNYCSCFLSRLFESKTSSKRTRDLNQFSTKRVLASKGPARPLSYHIYIHLPYQPAGVSKTSNSNSNFKPSNSGLPSGLKLYHNRSISAALISSTGKFRCSWISRLSYACCLSNPSQSNASFPMITQALFAAIPQMSFYEFQLKPFELCPWCLAWFRAGRFWKLHHSLRSSRRHPGCTGMGEHGIDKVKRGYFFGAITTQSMSRRLEEKRWKKNKHCDLNPMCTICCGLGRRSCVFDFCFPTNLRNP